MANIRPCLARPTEGWRLPVDVTNGRVTKNPLHSPRRQDAVGMKRGPDSDRDLVPYPVAPACKHTAARMADAKRNASNRLAIEVAFEKEKAERLERARRKRRAEEQQGRKRKVRAWALWCKVDVIGYISTCTVLLLARNVESAPPNDSRLTVHSSIHPRTLGTRDGTVTRACSVGILC